MGVKFSILIPAYKSNFLEECIDSILCQTYDNYEIIIVDDASPEDLYSIVKQYNDARVFYYRNEIGFGAYNVVGNWNECLKYASGDYVICIGDDDRLLPCCLEEYVKLIEKYPDITVYHAWSQVIDENGKIVELLQPRPEIESFFELIYFRWSGRRQYIGDFCFNSHFLRNNNGFYELPLAWGADDVTVAKCAMKAGIANTSKPCFEYRNNPLTISNNSKDVNIKLKSILEEFQWYDDIFSNVNRQLLSDTDSWYYDELLKIEDTSRLKMMLSEIMKDIRCNYLSIIKWFVECPNYHIERSRLLRRLFKQILIV